MVMCEHSERLIIIDPSLKDVHGQRYVLTCAIAERAVENGYNVIVFANKSFGSHHGIAGENVRPVFSLSTYDSFRLFEKKQVNQSLKNIIRMYIPVKFIRLLKWIESRLKVVLSLVDMQVAFVPDRNASIEDELRAALLKESVLSHDHVIVHTADAITYRAVLQFFLKAYPLGQSPCFHLCTPYDSHSMPFSVKGLSVKRVISYLYLMGVLNRDVFLYAESELLASSLSVAWRAKVIDLGGLVSRTDDGASSEPCIESDFAIYADRLLSEVYLSNKAHLPEKDVVIEDGVFTESGYNEKMSGAVVSKDGHPLFVKQILL